MKIEKLTDGWKLTDLYITAAVLCAPEMKFTGVERSEGEPQAMFVVKGDVVRIKEIVDSYFNGKYTVDAIAFKQQLQLLKSRLHARY